MGNWINWSLVIVGIICVIIELAMGAMTGFDLALVGAALAVGGGIGLLTGSANVGMLSAAGVALIYFALFRSWLKSKLTVRDQPTTAGVALGTISEGQLAFVVAGPVSADGYAWYQLSGLGLPANTGCEPPARTTPFGKWPVENPIRL